MRNSSKAPTFKGYTNEQAARILHRSPRSINNWKGQILNFKQHVIKGKSKNRKYISKIGLELLREKADGTYDIKQAHRQRLRFLNMIRQTVAPIYSKEHSDANKIILAIYNQQRLISNNNIKKLQQENSHLQNKVHYWHYWYNRAYAENQRLKSSWFYRLFHK